MIDAASTGRGGISFEVGGDMINDGVIHTDPGARVDIAVAGNYTSNKGRIVQTEAKESVQHTKPPDGLIGKLTNNQTFAIVVGGFILLVIVYLLYLYSGVNLSDFQ